MEKKTVEEKESIFIDYLQKPPYPIDDMLALIADVPSTKAEEWTALSLTAFAEAQDFPSAFRLIRARREALEQKLQGVAVRDALRKTTRDRLLTAFIDYCYTNYPADQFDLIVPPHAIMTEPPACSAYLPVVTVSLRPASTISNVFCIF